MSRAESGFAERVPSVSPGIIGPCIGAPGAGVAGTFGLASCICDGF